MKNGRRWNAVAGLLLALGLLPVGAAAQTSVEDLAQRCADAGGAVSRCTELAVAARALQGSTGILAGLGSEVPGSASTLGRRLGTTPRFALTARAAFAPVALPDLLDPGSEPSREASFVVPALHVGMAVGVFDGFFLLPTVGGFLSLDLLGQTNVLFLPTADGFDGKAASWTLGARVGILRESFTLPGVSVSVSHRDVQPLRFGDPMGAGSGWVDLDPTVTSVRATVGKDLLSVGILAGMGWDWYGGAATLSMSEGTRTEESSFSNRRSMIFGGASMNFLILQLSGEVGWARGFGGVPGYRNTPFDAAAGSAFGSLAFRLTI